MVSLKEAIKLTKNKSNSYCVGYNILYEDGTFGTNTMTNCYGSLVRDIRSYINHQGSADKAEYLLSRIQDKDGRGPNCWPNLPKGTQEMYLSWLFNDSVYKDVFVKAEAKKVLKDMVAVSKLDIPGNVLVSAMTAFRALTEFGRGCHTGMHFKRLVEAGCTPEFSVVLGHYMSTANLNPIYDTNHCILDANNVSVGWVINFCNKKMTNPHAMSFLESFTHIGVFELFNGGNSSNFWKWLHSNYAAFSEQEKVNGDDKNPFGRTNIVSYALKDNKYELLAKCCEKFYKEFM